MKRKRLSLFIFIILFFCFFGQKTALAANETVKNELMRQVEVLKREISVLQALLSNFQLRQNISASSYLAMDLSDNSVLLEKNPNQAYPIASVTKLMTSVVALENIEKNKEITLTDQMLKPFGYSPALYSGLSISAGNLLKAMLIQSTNDAAQSLASFLGEERFLQLMNQKAKDLGMDNTIFYDVHGLNPKNQSTAADLAKLLKYIYQNHEEILTTTKDNDFWLPDASGNLLKFYNLNNFYYFSSFIGGKTGYITEAKETLASVFNVSEKPVAIVILRSENREADVFAMLREIN
jgi:D-alanyl-D-alanine carboxypeptidase (penicillin-binding protein 5/6)